MPVTGYELSLHYSKRSLVCEEELQESREIVCIVPEISRYPDIAGSDL